MWLVVHGDGLVVDVCLLAVVASAKESLVEAAWHEADVLLLRGVVHGRFLLKHGRAVGAAEQQVAVCLAHFHVKVPCAEAEQGVVVGTDGELA